MRRLGTLGITLFGLWALILGLGSLLSSINLVVELATEPVRALAVISMMSPGIAFLIAGILLLAGRRSLARSFFEDEAIDMTVSPVPVLRMSLILSGIWMFVDAATSVIYAIAYPLASAVNDRVAFGSAQSNEPMYSIIAGAIPQVVLLVAAMLLVRYSASAASLIWNGREPKKGDAVDPLQSALPRCQACGEPYDPEDYEPGGDARCVRCGQSLHLAGA